MAYFLLNYFAKCLVLHVVLSGTFLFQPPLYQWAKKNEKGFPNVSASVYIILSIIIIDSTELFLVFLITMIDTKIDYIKFKCPLSLAVKISQFAFASLVSYSLFSKIPFTYMRIFIVTEFSFENISGKIFLRKYFWENISEKIFLIKVFLRK